MKLGLRLKAGAAALGLGLIASASPAAAEVTRTTENSFVTRHEVIVKATPKEVWLALISPAGWWQSAHTWSGDAKNMTLTPQAGGCFCEIIPEVNEPNRFTLQGSVEHMRVVQAYPEQALRMVGSLGPLQSEPVTGVLTIAISKVEAGTRIVWEYNVGGPMRYEIPVISKVVDGVMGSQISSLAAQLGLVSVPTVAPEPAPTPAPGAVGRRQAFCDSDQACRRAGCCAQAYERADYYTDSASRGACARSRYKATSAGDADSHPCNIASKPDHAGSQACA